MYILRHITRMPNGEHVGEHQLPPAPGTTVPLPVRGVHAREHLIPPAPGTAVTSARICAMTSTRKDMYKYSAVIHTLIPGSSQAYAGVGRYRVFRCTGHRMLAVHFVYFDSLTKPAFGHASNRWGMVSQRQLKKRNDFFRHHENHCHHSLG